MLEGADLGMCVNVFEYIFENPCSTVPDPWNLRFNLLVLSWLSLPLYYKFGREKHLTDIIMLLLFS